jgi:hypothetical protein
MRRPAAWRNFERLLTQIHKEVVPGAEVVHNSRLRGQSERLRQIDILLTQKVGIYSATVVVECPRYRSGARRRLSRV